MAPFLKSNELSTHARRLTHRFTDCAKIESDNFGTGINKEFSMPD